MVLKNNRTGSFTLPGESGYEKLTLDLAKKWGADVIRDSDGTVLSDDILQSGYDIYSTICIIRDHNEWAKKNLDKLQQCFLVTSPIIATTSELDINLMEDFFDEQFAINDTESSMKYWQVYDRTTDSLVARTAWDYDQEEKKVHLKDCILWHKYTVSFMVYRIWEEISMYNHTTNHWKKEHLMQIDPRYEETQEYLLQWLEHWCKTHKDTNVVRFTSLFYNFVWIWGNNEKNRFLYSDWASYDFTVSPYALDMFEKEYGYALSAEDFINQGKLHVTHMPPVQSKLDWMDFTNKFTIYFGKKLIDMIHKYGKKAYVFYDDSWIGLEPYNNHFQEFGFDGLIKCVFSGYEVRLCAGVKVDTHEIRLHPYLFPVGLGGAPTFMEGGNPTLDASLYWVRIRRALLRETVDRIGLGGYLHLVQEFPDFCDYIEKIANEFRDIKDLHQIGKPATKKAKIGVLHSWGKLRSWTLSGHFHETYMHTLIHINEALAGLPYEVSFINFEDVLKGKIDDLSIIINAGNAGDAWSGGDAWKDERVVERLTEWTYHGGVFIGVGEPSAVKGFDCYFRMAHVLGIDEDLGDRVCHGKWSYQVESIHGLLPDDYSIKSKLGVYLIDDKTKVLAEENLVPTLTIREVGNGKGVYLSDFQLTDANTRMLYNLLRYVTNDTDEKYVTDNIFTECAYYPLSQTLVVVNNSNHAQVTNVTTEKGKYQISLQPFETNIKKM